MRGGETSAIPNRALITASIMLATIMQGVDNTIANVALPHMQGSLSATQDQIAWVLTSYMVSTAIMMPLTGWLAGQFGIKYVFLISVLGFTVFSALCGGATSLTQLVIYRIGQGICGAALVPLSQSTLLSINPPERHGPAMAVWGMGVMLGPIMGPAVGGWLTENYDWRWIFYINLPLGLLALAVINATFKPHQRSKAVDIDYMGATLLATALTCVILLSSLGSTLLAEAPVSMLAILLLGVVSLGAFLYVETIVPDPLLPLSLFSNRAFVIATAIGFIVGMALFGSITLLPVYLQVVKGLDPTSAGLHLTPMMLGVFVSSIVSGQIITRIGRYRIFPICGTALMTIALILLSRIDVATPPFTASGYMLLLGLGLGMVMQILVMAVQNAVKYEQLGVATSGTTLFRSIGGAVGAALFGGIFAFALEANIAQAMPNAAVSLKDPAAIAALAEPMRTTYLALFVDALHPVFRTAAGLAFVSFLLSLGIKEVPLRTSIAPQPIGDAIETPRDATSLEELERIVTRMTAGENRWQVYKRTAARMGLTLEPDELWMLARIGEISGRTSTAELEQRLRIDGPQCARLVDRLAALGLANGSSDRSFELSDKGREEYQRLLRQREQDLKEMLADWEPDEHPDVREMMRQLANSFASTPPARPGPA
jgi:EmrB/QacA subfamily drug resistance transporter